MKRMLPLAAVMASLALAGRAEAQGSGSPSAVQSPATPNANSLDDTAKKLQAAAEKLEAASKSMEKASSKLAPSSDPKELVSGRIPWNGLFLKFTEKDKKATVATSWPLGHGAWTLSTEMTVPLDEATRRAPLLDRQGRQAPFQLKVGLDYNFMEDMLSSLLRGERTEKEKLCLRYLKEHRNVPGHQTCDAKEFDEWLARETTRVGTRRAPESALARGVPMGVAYTLGFEIGGSFDRQDVYVNDLAGKTSALNKWDFNLAAVARFYPRPWLAIPLRIGGAVEDPLKTKEVDRCTALATSDATISGKDCSKVLVVKSDEAVKGSAFVDAALVFAVPVPLAYALQPGFELRGRMDGLGAGAVTHVSGTLFVTPTEQPVALRFGVGMEYNVALADEPGSSPTYKRGDNWLIPFVLAGGSL